MVVFLILENENQMNRIVGTFILILTFCFVSLAEQKTGISLTAYSPNGRFLATGNHRGEVAFWDLQILKEVSLFHSKINQIELLKFLPDNKRLMIVDEFGTNLILVDVATGTEIKRLKYEGISDISSIEFSSDGQSMWIFSSPKYNSPFEAWLVNLSNDSFKAEKIKESNQWINNITRNLLASFSDKDNRISLISAKDGKEFRSFEIDKEFIIENSYSSVPKKVRMEFSNDGTKIFLYRKSIAPKKDSSDYIDKYIHNLSVYSVETGKLLKNTSFPANIDDEKSYRDEPEITVSLDSTKILLSEKSNESTNPTQLITTIDANSLQKISEQKFVKENIEWNEITPDGKYYITADANEKIKLYSIETQKQVSELFDTKGGFSLISVSPDDSKIAGATANGLIKIWSADGKELQKISTEVPLVKFITFTPDGQKLITVHDTSITKGSDEKTLTKFKIWDVATGKLIREFNNYFTLERSPTSFIMVTKQGDKLISDCGADDDKTLDFCMWNLQTGEFIGRSFPLPSESYSLFWLGDKQSFNLTAENETNKIAFRDEADFYLWDFVNQKLINQFEEQSDFRDALTKTEDGNLIIVSSYSYQYPEMRLVKIKGTEGLKTAPDDFFSYSINPQQNLGASFIVKPVKTEITTESPVSSANLEVRVKEQTKDLIISIDQKEEAKNFIELKNLETDEVDKILQGHTDDVIGFVFTNNSTRGISIGSDQTTRIWDLATGKELFQLK